MFGILVNIHFMYTLLSFEHCTICLAMIQTNCVCHASNTLYGQEKMRPYITKLSDHTDFFVWLETYAVRSCEEIANNNISDNSRTEKHVPLRMKVYRITLFDTH